MKCIETTILNLFVTEEGIGAYVNYFLTNPSNRRKTSNIKLFQFGIFLDIDNF